MKIRNLTLGEFLAVTAFLWAAVVAALLFDQTWLNALAFLGFAALTIERVVNLVRYRRSRSGRS